MRFNIVQQETGQIQCDLVVIPVLDNGSFVDSLGKEVDDKLNGYLGSYINKQVDCTKFGETTIIHSLGQVAIQYFLLVGVGKSEELTLDKVRELSANVIRVAKKSCAISVGSTIWRNLLPDEAPEQIASAMIEGSLLGSYTFDYYKTDKTSKNIEEFNFIEPTTAQIDGLRQAIERSIAITDGVILARDLVNHPAQYMTPSRMAECAEAISKETGMSLSVLNRDELVELKMNAFLAVSQGSNEPAKLIVLRYNGNPDSNEYVAYVGKGITFDSGGISLKPSENMGDMKGDMAGGAAVLGAMSVIGRLKPRANILGIVPCTENMPSGHAYRPGDVLSSFSGKTIEIITTDAEGRLVLADAIAYARHLGAVKIVDLATLTGACVVALGNVASGVITNRPDWLEVIMVAAQVTGEKLWQMPAFPEYKDQIKSDIADLKNSGGRMAGMITAGLFLNEFAQDTPWVHIDIAGTSDINKNRGYCVKGATGAGVRLLIQLAETLEK